MPKVFTSETQKIGKLGERAVELFLVKQGFEIIETNYCSKYGEIDLIARDVSRRTIHFIEVKAASFDSSVSCETVSIRPEENMTREKIRKFKRVVEVYLAQKRLQNTDWQLDLYVVYLDQSNKKAKLRRIENVVL